MARTRRDDTIRSADEVHTDVIVRDLVRPADVGAAVANDVIVGLLVLTLAAVSAVAATKLAVR